MDSVINFLQVWQSVAYILIFIGMFIEGETVLLAAAFLAQRGALDPAMVIFISLAGTFIGDSFWYYIGHKIKDSKHFIIRWAEKLARPFDKQIKNKPARMISISKFTYGLHHAILIRSGMLELGYKRYVKIIMPAIIVWVAVIGGTGFFFGASLNLIKKYVKYAGIFFLLLLVLMLGFEHFVSWISRKGLADK